MGSPIIKAIKRYDHAALQAQIASGASLEAVDDQGWTPLFHAAHRRDVAAIKLLLDAGANVNHGIESGFTALFSAVMSLNVQAVRTLIDAGARPAPLDGIDLHHYVKSREEPNSMEIIALLDRAASARLELTS